MGQTRSGRRRQEMREHLWPKGEAEMWRGVTKEKGWFAAPRYLPAVLALLDDKELRGDQDLSRVYIDLWTRTYDEGLVQVTSDKEHALACGFPNRVRSWRDRLRKLDELGFVKVFAVGASDFAYVGMVHPYIAVQRLHRAGRLKNERLWNLFIKSVADAGASKPTLPEDVVDLFADQDKEAKALKKGKKKTA